MQTHNSFKAMIMDGMKNAPKGPAVPAEPDRHGKYKENMYKIWNHEKPEWLPMGTNLGLLIPDVVLERPALNKGGTDWFGVEWEFSEVAGAPCVKPGYKMFDDISDWEDTIVFPDLDAIDWEKSAKELECEIDPQRPVEIVLFNGCFERMHSMMGFEDALCSLLMDPDECSAYFNAMADFKIALIDKLVEYYPVDCICYHDDWGHKTNTFFSVDVYEEIIYEPTKRIVDHVHEKGKFFTLHCCGKNEKLVPYMVKMGADSWESAQMDINDLAMLRKQVGTDLTIETVPKHPCYLDPDTPEEVLRSTLREQLYPIAKEGPTIVTQINACHPENKPIIFDEFYKISDEIYK